MSDEASASRRELLERWQALLTAVQAAAAEREGSLAESGSSNLAIRLPPAIEEVAKLLSDQSPTADADRTRTAHILAVAKLAEAIRIIMEPSVRVTNLVTTTHEDFFDSGGLELLRRRAELLGEIEDDLDVLLHSESQPPASERWMNELDKGLELVVGGRPDSALGHLIVALTLLVRWAVPEVASIPGTVSDLLDGVPSLHALATVVSHAQQIVAGMAEGASAPLAESMLIAESLVNAISRLTGSLPRAEIMGAVEVLRGT